MAKLNSDREALLFGLELAITAPKNAQDKVDEIVKMCEGIASRMTKEEVEECQRMVEHKLFGGIQ